MPNSVPNNRAVVPTPKMCLHPLLSRKAHLISFLNRDQCLQKIPGSGEFSQCCQQGRQAASACRNMHQLMLGRQLLSSCVRPLLNSNYACEQWQWNSSPRSSWLSTIFCPFFHMQPLNSKWLNCTKITTVKKNGKMAAQKWFPFCRVLNGQNFQNIFYHFLQKSYWNVSLD